MPSDRPPGHESQELTPAEWDSFLQVKMTAPRYDFLRCAQSEDLWRFIVGNNHDLFLDSNIHIMLAQKAGIDRTNCLIPDGRFRINPVSKKINFSYAYEDTIVRKKGVCEAAERKIIEFLKSNGIDVHA